MIKKPKSYPNNNLILFGDSMPFADNSGVKIYYEIVGNGPPLVLYHGLAGTHEDWIMYADYVTPLKEKYSLILMDARGQGKSDKPHLPEEHSLQNMVGDVTAVLDAIGLEKAHFWGYSMGGTVGFAIGVYAPERFNSLIIGAAGAYEKDMKEVIEKYQNYIHEYEQRIPFYDQGIEASITYIKKVRGEDVDDYVIDRWLNADPRALIAYCSYYENIGMSDHLPILNIPCLIYAGEEDTPIYGAAKMTADRMQSFCRFLI